MDFKVEHKDSPATIVKDLSESKSALDLLLKTGKAVELTFSQVKSYPRRTLRVGSRRLSLSQVARLIEAARKAREFSYAPYSRFNVGAAILAENQNGAVRIFKGGNVENAAYGSTVCAERTAAFKAVSEGFRTFLSYAVVGGFDDSKPEELKQAAQQDYITPCGPCRQVTNEFEANPCFVIMAKDTGGVLITTVEYILPCGFGPKALGVTASSYDRHLTH